MKYMSNPFLNVFLFHCFSTSSTFRQDEKHT